MSANVAQRLRHAAVLQIALSLGGMSSIANAEPAKAPPVARASPSDSGGSAPPSTPASSTPSDQAAADEAAALVASLATSSSDAAAGDQQRLNLYGFADFTYSRNLQGQGLSAYDTFAVGHLNLYVGSDLGDNWRWLSEVRFMYLPNGSSPASATIGLPTGTVTNTTVTDYTDFNRPVRWGGISIERAWLERSFHPLLTVRMGQFPSPYGIWNVDHGSPAIISVTRPFAIGQEIIPQYQTGLEVYGTWNLQTTQVGYHVTLSNGRGPIDTYQDLDNNKAVGGRVFIRQDSSFGTWTFGASGYRGQYTNRHSSFGLDPSGAPILASTVDLQYNELSLAADLKWEWGGLLLQGEGMINDVAYVSGGRPIDASQLSPGIPPGFTADHRRYGYYGLIGYRTPFLNIMPYFFAENYFEGTGAAAVRGGLNIRPTPRVVFKAEILNPWFWGTQLSTPASTLLVLQAAWSF